MHRLKGGEADRVIIIDVGATPAQNAVTKEQLRQENNLLYIQLTRSKRQTVFAYVGEQPMPDEYELSPTVLVKEATQFIQQQIKQPERASNDKLPTSAP